MADEQPLHKGFVLGSIAYSLGKKADDNKSHEWTVYVRAANPEAVMELVKKACEDEKVCKYVVDCCVTLTYARMFDMAM